MSPGRVPEGRSTTFYMFGAQGNQFRTVDITDGTADGRVAATAIQRDLSDLAGVRVRTHFACRERDALVQLARTLAGGQIEVAI